GIERTHPGRGMARRGIGGHACRERLRVAREAVPGGAAGRLVAAGRRELRRRGRGQGEKRSEEDRSHRGLLYENTRDRASTTATPAVMTPPLASATGTPVRSPIRPATRPPSVEKPKKTTVIMLMTRPRIPSWTAVWMAVVIAAIVTVWSAPR